MAPESSGYRAKREGTKKRKSVRGCVLGPEINSINLVLVQKGENEIAGLTDAKNPLRLGPKRANKIRKLFNLPRHWDNKGVKDAEKIKVSNLDVQRAVVKRITKEHPDGKKYYKAPRITRLLTAKRLRRKKVKRISKLKGIVENQKKLAQYKKLVEKRRNDQKQRKKSSMAQ